MSDFSAILLDTSVYFLVVSGSTWQNSIRHVFHVQMRSSFAGKWRQVSVASSCAGREDVLKMSAFHRLVLRRTPGELKTLSGQ